MNVNQEMQLAQDILDMIRMICPYAVVAGGAPRDWYFGDTCNDIDIYMTSPGLTVKVTQGLLESALGADVTFGNRITPIYKHMKGIVRIGECNIKGVKVQLIELDDTKRLFNVAEEFSVSVCKVHFRNGKIETTEDFLLSLCTGQMFLSEGYKWSDPHPKKMLDRFKGKFVASTKDRATRAVVRDRLKEYSHGQT